MNIQSKSPNPIGLDIGSRYIKACQLKVDASGVSIQASAAIPRLNMNAKESPLSAVEAQRIGDVLRRQGFVGNSVAVAMPDSKVLASSLELPPKTAEIPLQQIARAEFARTSRLQTEAFEFAFWDLPAPARAARSSYLMGIGCRHADSDALVESFDAAELSVDRIDVAACALVNGCRPLLAEPAEITAVVDIGWSSARLLVVHQGVITYMRSLEEYGMRTLRNLLVKKLAATDCPEAIDLLLSRIDLSPEPLGARPLAAGLDELRGTVRSHFDAMWIELRTSLSYSAHQYPEAPVKRVVLCGGGASIGGLTHEVKAKLSVDAVVASPAGRAIDPSMSLAYGLAWASVPTKQRGAA